MSCRPNAFGRKRPISAWAVWPSSSASSQAGQLSPPLARPKASEVRARPVGAARSGAAGVFPLRLARQGQAQARQDLGAPSPVHVLDRMQPAPAASAPVEERQVAVRTEDARIVARDARPLR